MYRAATNAQIKTGEGKAAARTHGPSGLTPCTLYINAARSGKKAKEQDGLGVTCGEADGDGPNMPRPRMGSSEASEVPDPNAEPGEVWYRRR